jgi:hypothetical protein
MEVITFFIKRYPRLLPIAMWSFLVLALALSLLSWWRPDFFIYQLEQFPVFKYELLVLIFFLLVFIYSIFLGMDSLSYFSKRERFLYAILLVVMFLTPPLLSMDIGAYLLAAQNFILPGHHVYLQPLSQASAWVDKLHSIWWLSSPNVYGPAFLVIAAGAAFAGQANFLGAVYLYKLLVLAVFIFSLYFFKKLTIAAGLGREVFWLYALNPALLVNWVLEGHNDIWMTVGLLLFYYFLDQRTVWRSWLAFWGAIFIKFTALLFYPLTFFKKGAWSWRRLVISSSLFFLGFAAFFYFSHLTPVTWIDNLLHLNQVCYYDCSVPIYFFGLFGTVGAYLRSALFLGLYGYIFYLFVWRRFEPLKFIFWSGLDLFFIQTMWLTPWYATILIPIGLLVPDKRYRYWVLGLTAYCLFHYLFI